MSTLTMRERLVETALTLCYQHGFHAVGVDRIAKEAGTSRATLYNHFESKDELALAVVAKRDAWWQETFSSEIKRLGGDDPLAQLRSVPEILREWFASDGFNGCLFINTASEFPSPHDPLHKAAKANVDAIRKIIAGVAARAGIERAASFAEQFNMIIEGAIVTEVIDRDGRAPDTAVQLAEALIAFHLSAATAAGAA